jgi:aspartyl-tRNA(Asn)/glutamyl-tRNA(Gln) amidotransferase subunit B
MIERFQSQYQLSAYDSGVLTSSKEIADYYEQTVSRSKSPKASANWVMNELLGRLNAAGIEIEKSPVASADLAELITKLEANEISGRMAKEVFEEMFQTSKGPTRIIQEKGLVQVSDVGQIETVVKKVIDANPGQVQEYRAGKTKLLGFFVGQVMKEMKGQGNPGVINECVKKLLG